MYIYKQKKKLLFSGVIGSKTTGILVGKSQYKHGYILVQQTLSPILSLPSLAKLNCHLIPYLSYRKINVTREVTHA
jgi:hypothetical protein